MKNSLFRTLQLAILLIILCSSLATANAQAPVCDARSKFGQPTGTDGGNIFDLFCNLPPTDIFAYFGGNTVTCKGCMEGGYTPYPHSYGWEIAGTPSCAAYGREMVIEFSAPVADVDVPVSGARTVSDNRGNVVRLNPSPNGFYRIARFEGPGITRITC
jgi:hypothetical protein